MNAIDARVWLVAVVTALTVACSPTNSATDMTFFVTSVAAGDGGSMGGLPGADAHCERLAEAADSRNRHWRAYLSAAGENGQPATHAKDRIGNGPWLNVKGVQIAASNEDLHGTTNKLSRRTSVTELGNPVPHDILTGSNPDGTLASGDATCQNWTSTEGQAIVGHSDKDGTCCGDRAQSWNSAHLSRGCSLPELRAMGGAALFYCFAID